MNISLTMFDIILRMLNFINCSYLLKRANLPRIMFYVITQDNHYIITTILCNLISYLLYFSMLKYVYIYINKDLYKKIYTRISIPVD